MHIDKKTQSSLSKYVVKKGGTIINGYLKERLKKSIESVHDELHQYVGYKILLDNCNSLSVGENMHKNLGYPETFIFWVELDIHHYFTILMPVHWTTLQKWIGP